MRYAPPPPPRRRPAPDAPEPIRRLIHSSEARHAAEERPFDPGAPREHYARPHHFAVNRLTRHLPGRPGYTLCGERADPATLTDDYRDSTCFYCTQAWNREHGMAPNARAQAPADTHAATELVLFIENTADLSPGGPSGQGHSVLINALRKWRKGTYDPVLGVRLFEYLAESGAKRYAREFDHPSRWSEIFNPATRRAVARQLEEDFRASVERGEYDDVDTRIGR